MHAACASGKRAAECALLWSVLDFTSCTSSHYRPASGCLIWNGYGFEPCDWLLGRLFCLWAVFPSIRRFFFFFFRAPYPSLSAPIHLHVDAHAGQTLTLLYVGLFQAGFWAHFLKSLATYSCQKKSVWTLLKYLDFCINYSQSHFS